MTETLQIHQNNFVLHPSGAIFWKEQEMLLIADVHLGKVHHFRKHGAPIPLQAAHKNLEMLTEVCNELQPKTVCFLGDLFHSKLNKEWQDFKKWVEYIPLKVVLVSGNHDIIPSYYYEEIGVKVLDELEIDNFLFTHHPTERDKKFTFSGHIHPGIKMKGFQGASVKLPCFYKTQNQLILPAFGNFTGKHILKPSSEDLVFAIAEGQVICVSNSH